MRPAIALYQPDIPGNTGTLMRFAACMDCELHIVEPAGFRLDDTSLKRAGMDYAERATVVRHKDWEEFRYWAENNRRRLVLFTTTASAPYTAFEFNAADLLLFGSESAGVPQDVHSQAASRLCIPMATGARSLNVALAAAMAYGEAIRQTQSE